MGKKVKRKLKKKWIVCIIILILIVGIGILSSILIKQENLRKDIQKHYHRNSITTKTTTLYNSNKKKIGSLSKDITITLEKIKKINSPYLKIENTPYYVYYKNLKKAEKEETKLNENYIPFNTNIKTNKKIVLYDNDKRIAILKNGINTAIYSQDENNYYVSFLEKIVSIKKDKNIKEIEHQNTNEKEATHVSILYYADIRDVCGNTTCITTESFKNQMNTLKEKKYYTITQEELEKYLNGYIHLKENALFLTTSTKDEIKDPLSKELSIHIYNQDANKKMKFFNTNMTTTKETKKEELNQYLIKNSTTMENILKMASGEEIKEPTLENQAIAVLNYHFFYSQALGEGCNESICLDTDKLREQLQYLKDNNYKTLTMEEFKKWMYGEIELPENSVLLTVDDGALGTGKHNGNKLNPILEEYKMNATLFLIAGWWDIENYRSEYLTIQSHTFDMHQYGSCGRGQINCATYEEAKIDLQKSLDIIGNNDSFCFPFYYYSDTSIQAVKDLGFKLAFVGGNRKATRKSNKYLVPRYPIHSDITLNNFINMVS